MNIVSAAPPDSDRRGDADRASNDVNESTLSAERPFPGLRPFAFADRKFFFGRESQAFALYRLVDGGRFIAVVGSSGSGKSSLVLAGLCDLLDQETQDPNGPLWLRRDMRPGASPIRRLADTLARISAADEAEIFRLRDRVEARLRQSSFSLQSALDEAGGLKGRRLLLIVDQFEELFRFGLAGLGQRSAGAAKAKARDEATLFVQILLDARRLPDVHVLVTMRSDFIGDCAYFAGLPEAVSATQYLVPGLTRLQLEEVIRRPIEQAGASIEPELVERLLNDCGEELDQLPVLQHCLMRMWDRARATSADGPRRLTRRTYDDIGRMAEALSRHADEVLRQCAGKELAVEQAFRALSELDREGRSTRRGRRFDKLLAETGVSEGDLRAVLDRFRAPSCSFLVPPLSAPLRDDEVVDIGHEALLRRWKILAGDGLAQRSPASSAAPGWLAEERADGDRYRTLVGLLDGEKANLTAPEETKGWWDRRPRTAAWAERYGGRFEEVRGLIDEAIEAQRREREEARITRRNRRLWTALGIVGILVAAGVFGFLQIAQERRRQEDLDKSAMRSAKTLLENVLGAYADKSLDLAGAESLARISGQFLDDTRAAAKTSAADLLWAQALNVEADLKATLDKDKEALDLARNAKKAVQPLIDAHPGAQDALQALYDASIRAGNALALMGRSRRTEALQEYTAAIGVAEKIAATGRGEVGVNDIIDAHIKIGDIDKDRGRAHDAEAEYRLSLAASEAALVKLPQSFTLLRNKGKAFFRLADLFRTQDAFDQARSFYAQAADVQQALVLRNAREAGGAPDAVDLSLKSNLAATLTHWGQLERKAGDLKLALAKLQQGSALNEELTKAQPGNPQWEDYAAPNYRFIAEIFDQTNRPKEALDSYRQYFEARRRLAFRGLGPVKARREFASAAKLLGDHASGLDQIEAYRSAVRTWSGMADDARLANEAAQQYDAILGMARFFESKTDWPDAQTAYHVAHKMATLNLVKDPSNSSWRDRADSAEKASVEAGLAAAATPPPP